MRNVKTRMVFILEDKRLRENVRTLGAAPSDWFHEASSGGSRRWQEPLWESVFCECKCPLVFAQPRDRTVVEGFQHGT